MLEGQAPNNAILIERDGEPEGGTAPAGRARPARGLRGAAVWWLSVAASVSIAVGGYVHLCLYRHGYRAIPVIGPGFLIQVISSAVLAVALVVPWRAVYLGRLVVHPATEVRLGALALSVGTLVAFGLTRRPGGLFNFQERGLQPAPQALIALLAEGSALILLALAVVLDWRSHHEGSAPPVPARPVPALVRVRRR
jgi:hypothetical protein